MTNRKCPVSGCKNRISTRQYVCISHWELLPLETRRRLNLRDSKALERLMVLRDQLENRVSLDCIVVPL